MAGEWASPEEVAIHEVRAARNEARLARVCAAADHMVLRGIARNLTAILPVYVRGDYMEDDFDETELSFLELCARLSGKIAASRQAIVQGLLFPLGEPSPRAPRACLFSPAELHALEEKDRDDAVRAVAWVAENKREAERRAEVLRWVKERRRDVLQLLNRARKICVVAHDVDVLEEERRLFEDKAYFAALQAEVWAADARMSEEMQARQGARAKEERARALARGKRPLPSGYAVEKQGSRWMVVDASGRRMRVDGTTKGDAVDRAHALADERAQAEKDATRH